MLLGREGRCISASLSLPHIRVLGIGRGTLAGHRWRTLRWELCLLSSLFAANRRDLPRIGPLRTPQFAMFLECGVFPSLVGHFLRFGRARGVCWGMWPCESLYAAKVCLKVSPPLSGGNKSRVATILLGLCYGGTVGRSPFVHPIVPESCRGVAVGGGVSGSCRGPFCRFSPATTWTLGGFFCD